MIKTQDKTQSVIRDKDFGRRLTQVCNDHPSVPAPNFGRLQWFVDELERRGVTVSRQTISRWLDGAYRPSREKMRVLAEILGTDEIWLSMGVAAPVKTTEIKDIQASVDGAAMVVAGLMMIDGLSPGFPLPTDSRADDTDIVVVAARRPQRVKVSLARKADGARSLFMVPNAFDDLTLVGAVQMDPVTLEFYTIPTKIVAENARPMGSHMELEVELRAGKAYVGNTSLGKILDFSTAFS